MRYALFDWDNTLRKGYALFSWTDFLVKNKVLPMSLSGQYNFWLNQNHNNHISHDELAILTCNAYAASLEGMTYESLEHYLDEYIQHDIEYLFAFTEELLSFLRKRDILPIIVSGAPSMIVEKYRDRLGLGAIYAFEPELKNNIFTGKVNVNNGYNKKAVVELLTQKYGGTPFISFGDAESDEPMLLAAQIGVIVSQKVFGEKKYTVIDPLDTPNNIIQSLKAHIGNA